LQQSRAIETIAVLLLDRARLQQAGMFAMLSFSFARGDTPASTLPTNAEIITKAESRFIITAELY